MKPLVEKVTSMINNLNQMKVIFLLNKTTVFQIISFRQIHFSWHYFIYFKYLIFRPIFFSKAIIIFNFKYFISIRSWHCNLLLQRNDNPRQRDRWVKHLFSQQIYFFYFKYLASLMGKVTLLINLSIWIRWKWYF